MTQTLLSLRSLLDSLLCESPEVQSEVLRSLSPLQLLELETATRWTPMDGPQAEAYRTQADILFYGGAAGGGKTDLALGLAGTQHKRSVVFRRIFPSLAWAIERSGQLYSLGAKYNSQMHAWTFPGEGRTVRFGSLQYDKDVLAWQGQPHDLYVFDELPEFTEAQFRYVTGWNRTTDEGQRCRVVCTGNPPTDSDGEWVIQFFAPWLDESHPNPARPGELRYFTTIKGKDVELPNGDPITVDGREVKPLSRTFIPAKLDDNPHLLRTGYREKLNALPEPLRSKMLFGDFKAGREDNAWQIVPSKWVDVAQERWRKRERPTTPMDAMGVDVARGGKDKTTIARRHGNWLDRVLRYPGMTTPNGPAVAGLVLVERRDNAVVQIDVIGVGSSPYDSLREKIGDKAVPLNGAEGSDARDAANTLGFVNFRAEAWWRIREALDPASGQDLALPPDPELKADLCAPRWKLTPRGIQVEAKEDVIKRIGRSPDVGDAAVNAVVIKRVVGAGWLEHAANELAKAKAAKAAAR